jgi:hypothetical protein
MFFLAVYLPAHLGPSFLLPKNDDKLDMMNREPTMNKDSHWNEKLNHDLLSHGINTNSPGGNWSYDNMVSIQWHNADFEKFCEQTCETNVHTLISLPFAFLPNRWHIYCQKFLQGAQLMHFQTYTQIKDILCINPQICNEQQFKANTL